MRRSNRHNLVSLLSVLQDLDEVQRGMPVSFLKTLLLVGMDEGQTAAEYGRRAGVDRFQMSRYMKTLGPHNVWRKCDGFGWVEETNHKRRGNQKGDFSNARRAQISYANFRRPGARPNFRRAAWSGTRRD